MANDGSARQPVVFTLPARCRDCYRCVRVCPVKAIRMENGQARVEVDRCIACGTCVRHCPQQAKAYRRDLERAATHIAAGGRVACSVAPSFASFLPEWKRRRLPSALRKLGFGYVGETAIGAYHVAKETAACVERGPNRRHICSACPAVVQYIERYKPEMARDLVPVVSPMIAHARHIRRRLGEETRVVFIGPCIAKKAEADRYASSGEVDCVLTFQELDDWFAREAIDLAALEESEFDETPGGDSRLFPIEGGCIRTAGWSADLLSAETLAVSGFESVDAAIADRRSRGVLEPLFCPNGCTGGPGVADRGNAFGGRRDLIEYATKSTHPEESAPTCVDLTATFEPQFKRGPHISEAAIRDVLEKTGKAAPENQLNCGACGYKTCREKAIAVLEGLAEPEMCMPYMKRLAEQRVDRIIETSPNGIVVLDSHLQILDMNPAFRRFFHCSMAVAGKPVSYLIDPQPFEEAADTTGSRLVDVVVEYPSYRLTCHVLVYYLPQERQYVGIFVDLTRSQQNQEQLDRLRRQTVLQARELLQQQLDMASTIATCLGENTARAESLLQRLMAEASVGGAAAGLSTACDALPASEGDGSLGTRSGHLHVPHPWQRRTK